MWLLNHEKYAKCTCTSRQKTRSAPAPHGEETGMIAHHASLLSFPESPRWCEARPSRLLQNIGEYIPRWCEARYSTNVVGHHQWRKNTVQREGTSILPRLQPESLYHSTQNPICPDRSCRLTLLGARPFWWRSSRQRSSARLAGEQHSRIGWARGVCNREKS